MGCHTWFYKKVDRTIEEARERYLSDLHESINSFQSMLDDPSDQTKIDLEWTDEFIQEAIDIWKRQKRMVEKGLCNVAVMKKQPADENGILYRFVNGNLYCYHHELPHDTFRRGDYPDDKLFSLEETLKYLEDNDDKIYYHYSFLDKTRKSVLKERAIKRLKKFWDEYPDGMILFG